MSIVWKIAGVAGLIVYVAVGCAATVTEADLEREKAYRLAAEQAEEIALDKLQDAEAELEAQSQITGELDTVREELESAQNRITALEGEKADLQGELTTKEQDLNDLNVQLSESEGKVAELEETNARLLDEKEALEAKIADLEAQVQNLEEADAEDMPEDDQEIDHEPEENQGDDEGGTDVSETRQETEILK